MDARSGGNTSPAHKCPLNRRKAANHIRRTENTDETGNVSEGSLTLGLRWMRVHSGRVRLRVSSEPSHQHQLVAFFGARHGAAPPDSWSRETNECLMIHAWWCDVTQCSSHKQIQKPEKRLFSHLEEQTTDWPADFWGALDHLSCDTSDAQKQPKPVELRGRTRPDVDRWSLCIHVCVVRCASV